MHLIARTLAWVIGLYVCWIAMMAVHEAGHVLHAWAAGTQVLRVDIPLVGFSQTYLGANPRPLSVARGGPLWGALIPLVVFAACARATRRVKRAAQFFAGFCLIVNGAYLGVGWTVRAGD